AVPDSGTGGGDGDSGPGTDAGCMSAAECPQPANSTAACDKGTCTFACAMPLLHCSNSCCGALRIAAGDSHTCVVTDTGEVLCWGDASATGAGAFTGMQPSPAPVRGLSGPALSVTAGDLHSCALIDGGAVQCWGITSVGNGSSAPAATATQV